MTVAALAVIWIGNREKASGSFGSVAVLPFRTVSDSGEDYLADGITEALITRLTNLNGLRVVSYSRVRRFKGSSDEAAKIGRQLGVEAVIDGTVRVDSGRLRVSVHGVDTKSGFTIWALDRLEAKPNGLLDIEGQLAEAVAQRVRGQLTANERRSGHQVARHQHRSLRPGSEGARGRAGTGCPNVATRC